MTQPISFEQKDQNTRIYHLKSGDVVVVKQDSGDFGSIFQDKDGQFFASGTKKASLAFVPKDEGINANLKDCENVSFKGSKFSDNFTLTDCKKTIVDGNGGDDHLIRIDYSWIKSDLATNQTKNIPKNNIQTFDYSIFKS